MFGNDAKLFEGAYVFGNDAKLFEGAYVFGNDAKLFEGACALAFSIVHVFETLSYFI